MVGGSGLSMLFLGAIGVFAGIGFGLQYSWIFIIPGLLVGGTIGVCTGAFGWEFFDHLGDKCRDAYVNKRYGVGTFWLAASFATLLCSYGGMLNWTCRFQWFLDSH
jgi:hypothetical protein